MVLFAIPIVTTLFTGIIGGATLHLTRRNNGQQAGTNRSQQQSEDLAVPSEISTEKVESVVIESKIQQRNNQRDALKEKGIQIEMAEMQNQKKSSVEDERRTFICPISNKLMVQPVELLCGHCFEKKNLIQYLKKNKKCPVCEKNSRCSQICYAPGVKNALERYKARKQARKMSRQRLIQDFGDDKLDFIINHIDEQKAHSDTQIIENLPEEKKNALQSHISLQM